MTFISRLRSRHRNSSLKVVRTEIKIIAGGEARDQNRADIIRKLSDETILPREAIHRDTKIPFPRG